MGTLFHKNLLLIKFSLHLDVLLWLQHDFLSQKGFILWEVELLK